jgi:hypothetical protein
MFELIRLPTWDQFSLTADKVLVLKTRDVIVTKRQLNKGSLVVVSGPFPLSSRKAAATSVGQITVGFVYATH